MTGDRSTPGTAAALGPVRIWDLPTRTFHWLLATLVVTSVVTAHLGGNAMAWHFRSGFAIVTLLAFRIVWGFVGGRWSRFGAFLYSPMTSLRYLNGGSLPHENHHVGHSPLGAWSVFALLAVLVAQVSTGLIADDDIASSGPLVRFVSNATSALATGWHKNWGQWILIGLVALHVAAIVYYALRRRQDLLTPMWHGDKRLDAGVPASKDSAGSRVLALAIVLACAGGVALLVNLGG